MSNSIRVRGDGLTLDLLLWRRFGRAGQTMVEATLALNPGLARHGVAIPLDFLVVLPDPPARVEVRQQPVSLFG